MSRATSTPLLDPDAESHLEFGIEPAAMLAQKKGRFSLRTQSYALGRAK